MSKFPLEFDVKKNALGILQYFEINDAGYSCECLVEINHKNGLNYVIETWAACSFPPLGVKLSCCSLQWSPAFKLSRSMDWQGHK